MAAPHQQQAVYLAAWKLVDVVVVQLPVHAEVQRYSVAPEKVIDSSSLFFAEEGLG